MGDGCAFMCDWVWSWPHSFCGLVLSPTESHCNVVLGPQMFSHPCIKQICRIAAAKYEHDPQGTFPALDPSEVMVQGWGSYDECKKQIQEWFLFSWHQSCSKLSTKLICQVCGHVPEAEGFEHSGFSKQELQQAELAKWRRNKNKVTIICTKLQTGNLNKQLFTLKIKVICSAKFIIIIIQFLTRE